MEKEFSKILEIAINMARQNDDGLIPFMEEQKARFDENKIELASHANTANSTQQTNNSLQ